MAQKYKKILITGANGFLGTNVVRHFASLGVKTRVIVRHSNPTLDSIESCEVVYGNVMNGGDMARAAESCDAIVHICAITSQSIPRYAPYRDFNVGALERSIEAARGAGIKRLVFVSSSNTIGNGRSMSEPADETVPLSGVYSKQFYGRSKVEAEAVLRAASDIEGVIVNPCFMIGAYDKSPSSGEMILIGYKKKMVVVPRGAKNVVDVEYAAEAVCNAVEMGRKGESYLLAGENITLKNFYKTLGEVDGVAKKYIGVPRWILLIPGYFGDLLRFFGVHTMASSLNVRAITMQESYTGKKAERELGLKKTDVKKAIAKAVKWFEENSMV